MIRPRAIDFARVPLMGPGVMRSTQSFGTRVIVGSSVQCILLWGSLSSHMRRFPNNGGRMDRDFVAPLTVLTVVAVGLGLLLWWFDWRDRRDAKREKHPDSK
jgi:hypothetical protein